MIDEIRRAGERRPIYVGAKIPRETSRPTTTTPTCVKVMVPLSPPEPFLFTQNTLRDLWEGAMDAQGNATRPCLLHRTIAVGPYELAVIPTGGGRSAIRAAVRAVLQGMPQGKEIEIFTPPALATDSASRAVIAVWIYQNASMAVVHLDFHHKEHYILWHAPDAHQFNYDYLEELETRSIHPEPGGSRPARPHPLHEVTVQSTI